MDTAAMIERVAKALYEQVTNADSDPFVTEWDNLREKYKDTWRDQARAAIKTMREPTEAMTTCPMATCYNYGPYGQAEVRRIWSAMIDEALSPQRNG